MLILQTIVFFFALMSTVLATSQFVINRTHKRDDYNVAPWIMAFCILWTMFFYLCHF